MTTANNPANLDTPTSAYALYNIIQAVRHSGAPTLAKAWSRVLRARWGSLEFARRHSEVVRLWDETLTQIDALPPESRKRLRSYAQSWWSAFIKPDSSWERTSPAKIITDVHLNHLADTSEILAPLGRATRVHDDKSLAGLRAVCEEWTAALDGRAKIVHEALRLKLVGQLQRLVWTIDNIGTFGVSGVADQGERITGMLVIAKNLRPEEIKDRDRFIGFLKRFAAALALATGVVTTLGALTNSVDHEVQAIEQLGHDIAHDVRTIGHPGEEAPTDHGGADR